MLPGVSRIRCPHTPGRTFLRPFRNHAAASAVRALGSRSSNSSSSFKAKPATARALLFSCPSLQVSADAPVHFFAQAAQVFLFFRLPPCVARLPAVQRDVSQISRVIIPKNVEQSGKTRRLFLDYSAVSRLFLRRRAAYPLYILNLCEEGKHRVPILCINFAAFFPFRPRANYRGAHFVYILTAFIAHSTTKHIHRAHYHNYLKIHNPKYPHVVIAHAR